MSFQIGLAVAVVSAALCAWAAFSARFLELDSEASYQEAVAAWRAEQQEGAK